jgi:G3E family GTPase
LRSAGRAHRRLGVAALRVVARRWRNRRAPTADLCAACRSAQTFFINQEVGDFYRIDSILCLADAKHVREHLNVRAQRPETHAEKRCSAGTARAPALYPHARRTRRTVPSARAARPLLFRSRQRSHARATPRPRQEVKADDAVNEAVQQVAFADRILLNKTDLVTPAELRAVREELASINAYAEVIETVQSRVDLNRVLGVSSFSVEQTLTVDPYFLEEEGAAAAAAEECAEPGCDDASHGHGHGHGHGAPEAKKLKADAPARKKRHDLSGVSSVGIQAEGKLDFNGLNGFMMRLLQANARDIYRSKGVLCFAGQGDAKFVFQGVHEQIHFGPSNATWAPDEPRINKMVFIGRKLDREALESGFRGCLVANMKADKADAEA